MSSSKRPLLSDSDSEDDQEYPNKTTKLNRDDPALSHVTGLDRIDFLETRLLKSYKEAKEFISRSKSDEARIKNVESQNFDLLKFMFENKQKLPNGEETCRKILPPPARFKLTRLQIYHPRSSPNLNCSQPPNMPPGPDSPSTGNTQILNNGARAILDGLL
jgi:hypothetical protein